MQYNNLLEIKTAKKVFVYFHIHAKGSSEIWSDKYIGIKVNSLCFKEVKPCFLGDKPNISEETKPCGFEF